MVAACFATVNVSVNLRTLTTSVPVTGTATNGPARPCLSRQTSGSMCLPQINSSLILSQKLVNVNAENEDQDEKHYSKSINDHLS